MLADYLPAIYCIEEGCMILWQIIAIVGLGFIILEMFTPSMFFLNFAIAAFITSLVSVYTTNITILATVFSVFSVVSFAFLRPILIQRFCKEKETGVNSKYIGQVAKAEEDITESSGVIAIYGERWDARSENGAVIAKGSDVKIVRNESIIMYVEIC